jgi:hypothetical protein
MARQSLTFLSTVVRGTTPTGAPPIPMPTRFYDAIVGNQPTYEMRLVGGRAGGGLEVVLVERLTRA